MSPKYVIFSAGSKHQHPTKSAAYRYMEYGVDEGNIFRTDYGDKEDGPYDWEQAGLPGCKDESGDDDIEIILKKGRAPLVRYRDDGYESCELVN